MRADRFLRTLAVSLMSCFAAGGVQAAADPRCPTNTDSAVRHIDGPFPVAAAAMHDRQRFDAVCFNHAAIHTSPGSVRPAARLPGTGNCGAVIARYSEPAQDALPSVDERAAQVTVYEYDDINRLTAVYCRHNDGSARDWVSFSYDRTGNRQKKYRQDPTLVELATFSACRIRRGVLVVWCTAAEYETVGFNLYRRAQGGGRFAKVTARPVVARGSADSGAKYSFVDHPPDHGDVWHYLLEEIDRQGAVHRYGPIASRDRTRPFVEQIVPFFKKICRWLNREQRGR